MSRRRARHNQPDDFLSELEPEIEGETLYARSNFVYAGNQYRRGDKLSTGVFRRDEHLERCIRQRLVGRVPVAPYAQAG